MNELQIFNSEEFGDIRTVTIENEPCRIGGMIMLYKTLKKLKERNGLTEDLKNKIDIFFATGRITEEQYNDLMDIGNEEIR